MTLWRSSYRYLLRHPWLLGLSILGVALGVAVVVAIDLANSSARRAFDLSAETVTGRATHQIVGQGGTLTADVYRQVRQEVGLRDVAPVVEGFASVVADTGRTVQVLGIDPLAEAPFRPFLGNESGLDLGAFMGAPNTALLAAPTAAALGLTTGDTLRVRIDGVTEALRLVGEIAPADERSRQALRNLLVVDVSTAQELFGLYGHLSRIDVLLPPDDASAVAALQAALPPGVEVIRSTARTETVAQMTRAFELNLTALSLLALVVGMFLIYNTMTFSVVQRRALIGRLRALGVTRKEIFGLVLGEAVAIGAVGTGLGVLLGIVLGNGLVQLVTQTINDLYYVLTVRELTLDPLMLAKGALLGLGTTVIAALAPAQEATTAPASTVLQRSQEETQTRARIPKLTLLGAVLAAVGAGLLLLPTRSIAVSYGALFLVLMAFALFVPVAMLGFTRLLRPPMGRLFGLLGRMAANALTATLSRTAVATAALMIAIAATVGVGVMVESFRETVVTWLSYSLQADVYVQPPGFVQRRGDATLRPEVVERIRATPGVEELLGVRHVVVSTERGPSDLVAINQGQRTPRTFRFKEGDPDQVWRDFRTENIVIASEPYSYRFGVGVGDTLRLQTDRGPQAFAIAGIFFDYGSDLGAIMMSRQNYQRYYDDPGWSGVALVAQEGQNLDALIDRLQARAGGEQALFIRSNRALRDFSLEVFDRTFAITGVLRLLAMGVAFIGVLSALMALQLERAREFAVLRANGLTPPQLGRYVTMQTSLMGLLAGLLAIPLGLVLALVLIYVINRRSFGWTLQFELPPELLIQAVVLALVAAVLAGLYPAWKMARANPADALRA